MPGKRIRPLTELAPGEEAVLAKIKTEQKEQDRLKDLGLHSGVYVRLLEGAVDNSVLIAVGDGRVGVNYAIAEKIFVF